MDGGYNHKTGEKDWDKYEVVLRQGRWAIANKRNGLVFMVYDSEDKANTALSSYKEGMRGRKTFRGLT